MLTFIVYKVPIVFGVLSEGGILWIKYHKENIGNLHAEPKAREHLRPVIRESWERSIGYGISPNKPGPPIYSEAELACYPNLYYVLDIARPISQKVLR